MECGLNFLRQYYSEVKKGARNGIDMMMVSRFEGELPSQYIGQEFNVPLPEMYRQRWQSESYPCLLPTGVEGRLTFETYSL